MAEENDPPKGDEFTPITSQADLDKLIGARIGAVRSKFSDYDELKAKASKFDEAEQASKTEIQKEREARESAERERDSLLLDGLRTKVALAKGLTASQAKRLVGTTKEELEADADELLTDLGQPGKQAKQPGGGRKGLQSGSKGSGSDAGLTGKENAAALLRAYRQASH